jgi:hypothetical protein
MANVACGPSQQQIRGDGTAKTTVARNNLAIFPTAQRLEVSLFATRCEVLVRKPPRVAWPPGEDVREQARRFPAF